VTVLAVVDAAFVFATLGVFQLSSTMLVPSAAAACFHAVYVSAVMPASNL
jgi:hypothetical protein